MSVLQPFFFNLLTPTVPDAPTGVSASAGNAQATVSFSAPANNGGAAITSYTATSSPGGFTASGSSSPLTVTGLTNGTSYTFTVYATNSVGNSSNSSPSSSVTPVAPYAAGNIYTLLGSTAGSYTFHWNSTYNILSDTAGSLWWNDYSGGVMYQWGNSQPFNNFSLHTALVQYNFGNSNWNPIGFGLIPSKLGALVFDRYSNQLQFVDFVYNRTTNLGNLPASISGWGVAVAGTTDGTAYIAGGTSHDLFKYSGWSYNGSTGTFTPGSFSTCQQINATNMYGVAADTNGNYFVFAAATGYVYEWLSSTLNFDNPTTTYSGLSTPYGGSIGDDGKLYIGEYNATFKQATVSNSSSVTVIAGTGTSGNSPDGTAATSANIGNTLCGTYGFINPNYKYFPHYYIVDATNNKLWMIY